MQPGRSQPQSLWHGWLERKTGLNLKIRRGNMGRGLMGWMKDLSRSTPTQQRSQPPSAKPVEHVGGAATHRLSLKQHTGQRSHPPSL
jgi:hypothetical protein